MFGEEASRMMTGTHAYTKTAGGRSGRMPLPKNLSFQMACDGGKLGSLEGKLDETCSHLSSFLPVPGVARPWTGSSRTVLSWASWR